LIVFCTLQIFIRKLSHGMKEENLTYGGSFSQWMYLIPLGLIVMNAMTQAMNLPEEQATGQPGAQPAAAIQRGPNPAVRRR
jgi:hypothetical protein